MPGKFLSPDGDLETMFVNDYAMIDQYAATGSLWAWGENIYGNIGDNTVTPRSSPVQTVSGGTNWKQVTAGRGTYDVTGAIKTDGTLWLWGSSAIGQLGNNSVTPRSSPVQTVSGGTNWKQISATGQTVAAIKTDGTLWLWGSNGFGEMGDNTGVHKSSPVQTVAGGNNWKQVSAGQTLAAIKTDGTLWTWGYGFSGALGNNVFFSAPRSSPIQTVAGGTNWKQVSTGWSHIAAIKTDGTLWIWGSNSGGALGDNTTAEKSSPIQTIASGNNWKQVSTGLNRTSAIKTNGTLWSWGSNSVGELGDNTTVDKSSPVQTVSGGTNWKQVSHFRTGVGAVKTDGSLWLWGSNPNGELGDNTIIAKSSPVQTAAGGTNWKSVQNSAGGGQPLAIYFYDAGNLYPSA